MLFSAVTASTLDLCKKIRLDPDGKRLAIVTVVNENNIEKLDDVLESGADQCIIESIYDEKRLHIRLAFAEKMAREKTDQAVTEQRLRESEAKARSILETTVDAIITINTKGNIRSFNKTAEKLFGYGSKEVIGKNVKILMPVPINPNMTIISTSTWTPESEKSSGSAGR